MGKFINPYNFVTVSKEKPEKKDIESGLGEMTGKITCELEVKTPIIIPDASSDNAFRQSDLYKDHKSYEFFSYEQLKDGKAGAEGPKHPVIPGSQLRGVIRSAYETVSDSCFSIINDKVTVSRRVASAKKPAILFREKDGKYRLYNAKRYMLQLENYPYAENDYNNVYTKILKVYDEEEKEYLGFVRTAKMLKEMAEKVENSEEKNKISELYEERKKFIDSLKTEKGLAERNTGYKKISAKLLELYRNQANKEFMDRFILREGQAVFFDDSYADQFVTSGGHSVPGVAVIRDRSLKGEKRCNAVVVKYKNGENDNMGYFHWSENFGDRFPGKKHHESIFERDQVVASFDDLSSEHVEGLLKQLEKLTEQYDDPKYNAQLKDDYMLHRGHRGYRKALKRFMSGDDDHLCVYYSNVEDVYYFSPAQITKEVYRNQIRSAIGKKGACTDRRELCPACRLFGMTSEMSAVGSRVRVTDANCISDFAYGEVKTLSILGGPKPSASEFYLRKSGQYWNYDYQSDDGKKKTLYEAIIRGRKYYWHYQPVDEIVRADNMNTSVRPLIKGKFRFDVFFEKLTEEELKSLIWVLTIGGNDSNNYHKIGHGKPLGYGSVKITVTDVLKREDHGKQVSLDVNMLCDLPNAWKNSVSVKEYSIITDWNALSDAEKKLIHYPYVDGGKKEEVFKWFQKNVPLKGREQLIRKSLPEITAISKTLSTDF